MMQTILGAGGPIGKDLATALESYNSKVRLVSRTPKAVTGKEELLAADLTHRENVFRAVEGSEVVYLTVGFTYNLKVWKELWPPLIKNVTDACISTGARLVFFDNVYSYGLDAIGHMTETSVVDPPSKKGQIRARIAASIMELSGKGNLMALIARSADFYGPGNSNSILSEMVFKNLKKGKPAMWLMNADKVHSFTYSPDAAKATAILGNTPDAFNQVWHLPTSNETLTGRDWVNLFGQKMQARARLRVMPGWMLSVTGLFVPIMKEFREMAYQYDRDYFFDSQKFARRFSFVPTPAAAGVEAVCQFS